MEHFVELIVACIVALSGFLFWAIWREEPGAAKDLLEECVKVGEDSLIYPWYDLVVASKINSVEDQGTFEKIVAGFPQDVQAIARELRTLLADVYPGVTEVPWGVQKNIGYGVGPKKMTEHFCYIMPLSKHVNLGFMQGAFLADPKKKLEGTGKSLRHVKVRSVDEARDPALRDLVKKAAARLKP